MAHSAVLIRDRVALLQQIAEEATNRKAQKRRYIQREGALTIAQGQQLAAESAERNEEGESGVAKRPRLEGANATQRRCSRCNRPGHNARTCDQDRVVSAILE